MISPSKTYAVRTTDGIDLFAAEWGNRDGPAILLIHGQAQCHLSFVRQIESTLAERYRMVAFDLRGHGASDKPLKPERYQEGRLWADDVNAVIEALDLARPVIAGWSLGGRILRQYLIHYGDGRLAGINFLATRPIEDPAVVGPAARAIGASVGLPLDRRLQAEIDFLRDCYEKQPAERDLHLQIAFNMLLPRPVRDAIAAWRTDPQATRRALALISVPTLITHGRLDKLILPLAAEMTAAAVPRATISWYEDCGHAPFYEDAPRYNAELGQLARGST